METKKCKECGAEIAESAAVCPKCGYRCDGEATAAASRPDWDVSGVVEEDRSATEIVRAAADKHRGFTAFGKYGKYVFLALTVIFGLAAFLTYKFWTTEALRDKTAQALLSKEQWLIGIGCLFAAVFACYEAICDWVTIVRYDKWIETEKIDRKALIGKLSGMMVSMSAQKTIKNTILLLVAARYSKDGKLVAKVVLRAVLTFVFSFAAAVLMWIFLTGYVKGVVDYQVKIYLFGKVGPDAWGGATRISPVIPNKACCLVALVLYFIALITEVFGLLNSKQIQKIHDESLK